jgi:diacylglycerol kinase (ATP)
LYCITSSGKIPICSGKEKSVYWIFQETVNIGVFFYYNDSDMKKPLYQSFGFAFRGLWTALKTERNVKIHTAAGLIAVGVGVYLGLTAIEWCLVILTIGFVLAAELFNTAMEKACDDVGEGKKSDGIKACKDISAAAVLVAAITALVIGIVVLIIPFFQKITG